MKIPFFILTVFLFPLLSATVTAASKHGAPQDPVRSACIHASYPGLCLRMLSSYSGSANTPRVLAQAAVKVSLSCARKLSSYLTTVTVTGKSKRERAAVSDCMEQVAKSVDELSKTLGELRRLRGETFEFHMSNAQTWVNAALTNKDTCLNEFEGVDGKKMIMSVAKVTSNALYMINRLDGSQGRDQLNP
ncbi:ARM repeat superfamily protein isoform 1 [Hibiscus syriacus]|uniref:ARM repeat superfamily protein isoform 1 n=1 Tax=Hibiscus syriacus TaxID=106335 RepID=A0A6A3A2B5_HIBSY|nr:pectinesterase inhibitor 3-like [Hibiscus syriacus]KAE8698411.1 ARM repeat superfamily protein isoform 1 [Hibiscus syriacus]